MRNQPMTELNGFSPNEANFAQELSRLAPIRPITAADQIWAIASGRIERKQVRFWRGISGVLAVALMIALWPQTSARPPVVRDPAAVAIPWQYEPTFFESGERDSKSKYAQLSYSDADYILLSQDSPDRRVVLDTGFNLSDGLNKSPFDDRLYGAEFGNVDGFQASEINSQSGLENDPVDTADVDPSIRLDTTRTAVPVVLDFGVPNN